MISKLPTSEAFNCKTSKLTFSSFKGTSTVIHTLTPRGTRHKPSGTITVDITAPQTGPETVSMYVTSLPLSGCPGVSLVMMAVKSVSVSISETVV